MSKIKTLLKQSCFYGAFSQLRKYYKYVYYRVVPVKTVINRFYWNRFHKRINWDAPQDLNEKINWLKLYSDTSQWTLLADKYSVREYVASKGLSDILVPLIGCWGGVESIDFNKLKSNNGPLVLKTTHGWGDVVYFDKSSNVDIVKKTLKRNLRHKHGYSTGEPHYFKIKPRILAEKCLIQTDFQGSDSLIDYKIWCFSGIPRFIWACYNRTKNYVYVESHDTNWSFHPEYSVFNDNYRDGGGILPKPKNLDRMLNIASTLSQGFPEVRIDLYNIDGTIYFGEMTFTSDGGYNNFFTDTFLKELGTLIKI